MKINAEQAVDTYGNQLIGIQVITEPEGSWPGGLCEIINLAEEDNQGNLPIKISFNVKKLFERTADQDEDEVPDEIGVLEYEDITILHANALTTRT